MGAPDGDKAGLIVLPSMVVFFCPDELQTGDPPEMFSIAGKQWDSVCEGDARNQAVTHADRLPRAIEGTPNVRRSFRCLPVEG